MLNQIPMMSEDWKTEVWFQIKNTDTSSQMEMLSFRSKETTEPILRVAIQTQPTLQLVIELYGMVITLPQTLVINDWYKLDVIFHKLNNVVDYTG